MRSATAPDTMVAAVAANIVWKNRNVQFHDPSPSASPGMPSPPHPNQPPAADAPNISDAPST